MISSWKRKSNVSVVKSDGYLLLLVLQIKFVFSASNNNNNSYLNIYGEPLQQCSVNGMALTGFTRTGYCVEQQDDSGSHHICIDLNSTTGGNFCDVTGQSNWCSSTDMPCTENPYDTTCAIEHWCVCQWAFSSYINKAGGCDQIQDIQCDAINIEAIIAYQRTSGYETAYQCLVDRCNLDPNQTVEYYASLANGNGSSFRNSRMASIRKNSPIKFTIFVVLSVALLVCMVVMAFFKKNQKGKIVSLLSSSSSSSLASSKNTALLLGMEDTRRDNKIDYNTQGRKLS